MNRHETWKKQGRYKSLGLQGNRKGEKMILEMDKETGATVLSPSAKKKKMAKKMKQSFIERLEAHKAEGASFDNGTWRPSRKGQTFIQALEEHKAKHEFD